ncbi:hypothetical protein U1Q18_031073, partial [Sarracenia purpurea var. burkii]
IKGALNPSSPHVCGKHPIPISSSHGRAPFPFENQEREVPHYRDAINIQLGHHHRVASDETSPP